MKLYYPKPGRTLFALEWMPQGVLEATANFQGVVHDVLRRLVMEVCHVWVNDVMLWGRTAKELIGRVAELERFIERGSSVVALQAVLSRKEKYPGAAEVHDPGREQGLVEIWRKEGNGELQRSRKTVSRVLAEIPNLAEAKATLRNLLGPRLERANGSRRVESRRTIGDVQLAQDREQAEENEQELVSQRTGLYHLPPERMVVKLSDAGHLWLERCVTPVPPEKEAHEVMV